MSRMKQRRGWTSGSRLQLSRLSLAFLIAAAFTIPAAPAQTFTVLHTFTGGKDGASPVAGLISDGKGNLYGTTPGGTALGNVFKLDLAGKETVLHAFAGSPDGASPSAALLRDAKGNLYGTTLTGGMFNRGTVFKVTHTGRELVLHSFTGQKDGGFPAAALIQDQAGNFYGTTSNGGRHNVGTVFRLRQSGRMEVIYSFKGGVDGATPVSAVVRDADGNLYGTADTGGDSGCDCGVVFRIDQHGKETVMHTFRGPDGSRPQGGLVLDARGNLYGTTTAGGASNAGTVFKVDQHGRETVLHSFAAMEGVEPSSTLVRDTQGNLYGTASDGGPSDTGTIFKLDKTGSFMVLHDFNGTKDGYFLLAGLFRDAEGNLFGAAQLGGKFGFGTVFELAP